MRYEFPRQNRPAGFGSRHRLAAHQQSVQGGLLRLLMRGQPVAAPEAQRLGLVQELVPHDLLWARAHELAAEIAQLAPESVALTKRVLNETVGEHVLTELSAAAAATATARTTDASVEGVAAFLQKRTPKWD